MIVRPRAEADLAPLVALLAVTHAEHDYPQRASNVRAGFLADPAELGAWVAEQDGAVVGHVALHPVHGPCAPLWRSATGTAADGSEDSRLAVVARLVSAAPGVGRLLMGHAVDAAADAGRTPVLEVFGPAQGFYERLGWRSVGTVEQVWARPVSVQVMVPPGA